MQTVTFIQQQLLFLRYHFIFIYIFLQLYAGSTELVAQDRELIQKIEDITRPVESKITLNEYYLNEHKINSKRFSLHQPGYFQYFERYYYATDRRPGENRQILLKAVITRIEKEEKIYLKKYIFDDEGQVIYYNEIEAETSEAPKNEIRVYIHKNQPIKYLDKDQENLLDEESLNKKTGIIVEEAAKYQQKFKSQMQDIQYY